MAMLNNQMVYIVFEYMAPNEAAKIGVFINTGCILVREDRGPVSPRWKS